jgi:hypothetical protein
MIGCEENGHTYKTRCEKANIDNTPALKLKTRSQTWREKNDVSEGGCKGTYHARL